MEAAVDRALKESLAEADMRPTEAYAGLTPVFVDGDTPQIREGDMVIVKLDPSLCETFIPPATRAQKMAINAHLYDTYHHHRDLGERVYQPDFRDTKDDKEVYTSSFRGALVKPDHYLEFCDTLKASQFLTRPFQLRKDGRLPNRVVVQLLPYLVAYVRYTPAI